jgi:hypothetical protein
MVQVILNGLVGITFSLMAVGLGVWLVVYNKGSRREMAFGLLVALEMVALVVLNDKTPEPENLRG